MKHKFLKLKDSQLQVAGILVLVLLAVLNHKLRQESHPGGTDFH